MEDIIEQFTELGFYENDAKVYVTLLQLGKSNPTKISKRTNIVRARVYDSLKRLEQQGYIEREAVKHAPMYAAVKPDKIFSDIKYELTNKLNLSEQLSNFINEKIKIAPDKGTWAIKGSNKIESRIKQIISEANNEILLLITPDYSKNSSKWIFDLLLDKTKQSIKLSIGLKIEENNALEVKELIKKGVNVYHWNLTEEMPLGVYTSDSKTTLITVISSWKRYPEHDMGFVIQGREAQHKGFEFLTQWFFSSCKKAEDKLAEFK